MRDKAKVYDVEVRISWTDVDDIMVDEDNSSLLLYSYEHWDKGEEVEWVDDENLEEFFVFTVEDYSW